MTKKVVELTPKSYKDVYIVLNDLYDFLYKDFKRYYPGFSSWYQNKVTKQFISGERKIFLIVENDNIYGVSIIKTSNENKICSFFLLPEIRKNGFGKELLEISIDNFKNKLQEPIFITVPEERLKEKITDNKTFEHFLNGNKFNLIDKKTGIYRDGKEEYIFQYFPNI